MKKTILITALNFVIKTLGYNLLLIFAFLMMTSSVSATETSSEHNIEESKKNNPENDYYIGFFAGTGKAYNSHTDVEGFANWGHPGSSVDYESTDTVGGVLIGRKVKLNGVPVRLELDGSLGKISARTNQLDPETLDETAHSDIVWLVTARAGLEKDFGHATLFANGGLAMAEIHNSVIDLDFRPDGTQQVDPDDSFEDESIRLGWVIGVGAEFPLTEDSRAFLGDKEIWTLRVEGFHADFGEEIYTVNRSGNNRCGVGGSYKACAYNIDNKVNVFRIVFSRPFSL